MKLSTDNARGALYMTICMAGFGLNDALVKSISIDLSLFQMVFLRGLFATAFISILWWRSADTVRKPSSRDLKMLSWRLIGEVGGTLCFLTAIFNMPLANATAILQVMPLAVTLCAAWFLGEQVDWRLYVAIGLGFIGMLIIVQPGTAHFDQYSLWAVAACSFLVVRDLTTRQLSTAMPSRFITLVTSVVITLLAGIASLFSSWAAITPGSLAILALAAAFVTAGYLFGVLAMRTGDVSAVAPFRYSILIWAMLLGFVFFDEWPSTTTLIGSSILVAMGIYTIRRNTA